MKKIISFLFVLTLLVGCSTTKGKNRVSNESWIAGDGSYLVLKEDQSYSWAMDKDVQDDNIFIGNYTVYVGKDAIEYLTDDFLVEEGLNVDEFQHSIEQNNKMYKKSNFVVLILNRTDGIIDGEKSLDTYETLYFGYIIDEGNEVALDLVNFNTMNYASFVLDK